MISCWRGAAQVVLDPRQPTVVTDYLEYVRESDIGKAIAFIKKVCVPLSPLLQVSLCCCRDGRH